MTPRWILTFFETWNPCAECQSAFAIGHVSMPGSSCSELLPLKPFRFGKTGLDLFQKQMLAYSFGIDWNHLSGAKSIARKATNDLNYSLCNTQQLTPPFCRGHTAGRRRFNFP
jgi:hypothetical protein